MVASVELVLERGERLELLVDKTDNLQQQVLNKTFCDRYSVCMCHVDAESDALFMLRFVYFFLLTTPVHPLLFNPSRLLSVGRSFSR